MINKREFLKEYNITEQEFREAEMEWSELEAIYANYKEIEDKLRRLGKEFVNDYLYDIERAGIHSYRYRTKAAGHLIEKIIRKRREAKDPGRPEGVTLSTMHSSKGLEYRIVFVVDANEGIVPHHKAGLPADIEEERRLFYVAMTRAKERLHLCAVKERYHRKQEISRFVKECMD